MPHRLGLSETILVFAQHVEFLGGFDALLEKLSDIRQRCAEKKVFVEADAEQALELAKRGIDGIQFDKLDVDELHFVKQLDLRIVARFLGVNSCKAHASPNPLHSSAAQVRRLPWVNVSLSPFQTRYSPFKAAIASPSFSFDLLRSSMLSSRKPAATGSSTPSR